MKVVICDYCDRDARLVGGNIIYPHRFDLHGGWYWYCEPCEAYVGCHKNSSKHSPLGRLADAELRRWKMAAHLNFDKIWRSKEMSRTKAYGYLADRLNIEKKKCHIGMFDVETCKKVVSICNEDNKIRMSSRRIR